MQIYHVERKDRGVDYDEYSDFVCVAESEDAARRMHPQDDWRPVYRVNDDGYFEAEHAGGWRLVRETLDLTWVAHIDDVAVTLIGTATEATARVVCSSYHAG